MRRDEINVTYSAEIGGSRVRVVSLHLRHHHCSLLYMVFLRISN